jgi:hypothetical protein
MTSTLHCNKTGVMGRKPLIGTLRTHYGPHFTIRISRTAVPSAKLSATIAKTR